MNLEFSEEQNMLRDLVRGVCSTYASLDTVRAMEDDPIGYPAEFWTQLAALDLTGLMIPEPYGGSGMTALEGAVVYEELGRALAPSPHFVSAIVAAGLLLRQGSDRQKQQWLPAIATGDAIITTASLEPNGGFGPRGVQTTATADGDGFVLDGTKWHVPFAAAATQLVVLARTGPSPADVDLFVVDPAAPGVTLTQQFSLASDCQYQVHLAGVRVPATDRLGDPGSGWAAWEAVRLEGLVFLAAQAIGGAGYALEITVQYAKDRQQFDKPLGAFQAISHYLADAATDVNGGRILVYEAAWALANHTPIDALAPMAKLFAGQTFRNGTAMAQQVFGGVGFTLDYDIQLYFRRAKTLQVAWLDDVTLREMVAATVLDQPA
ncbi:MAG: acyl-CoA dehydrogenase [Acidimicrobiia bacterium]|nr:acyl-CoA dehydrogenase [Acidimicrobiia bacterium]